jgi:hypothetical protein
MDEVDEGEVRETGGAYEIARSLTEMIALPPEFVWLRWLTPDEQHAFFQALMDALAQAWRSLNITPLRQEIERWQQQAQERKTATTESERQALWARHEQRLDQQRALIDELLQETAGGADSAPSTSEIRDLLGKHIPYGDSLSGEIVTTRYEEQ